jgi:hypothetical protein
MIRTCGGMLELEISSDTSSPKIQKPASQQVSRIRWSGWGVANIALTVIVLNYARVPMIANSLLWQLVTRSLWVCTFPLLMWLPIIVIQWLLLRRYTRSFLLWVLISAFAGFISGLITQVVTIPITNLYFSGIEDYRYLTVIEIALAVIIALVPGLTIGMAQWVMLRERLAQAAIWIGINALSYLFASLISWYISLGSHPEHLVFSFVPFGLY